jgi:hypothetical protein
VTRLVALFAGLAIALPGCGGGDSTSTTADTGGTLVTYIRTGGFASMPIRMEIQADGSAAVVAGVDPAREAFEIDADELGRLRSELDDADLGSYETPAEPTGCADCYEYQIAYNGTTIAYDESEKVPEEITTAVAHLSDLADAHYPPDADQPPIVN